jgi:predicted regulator of Ras-like GTPase activity (Roadblock/LC7/MglB family)
MPEDVKALSADLARDPQSLVFLRLGEALRQKRQFEAATRIALHGLERHPHLADGHDLYARILADRHDYEHAFDEWDMALRIAPQHIGALKGLAFLYFKVGDLAQAEAHLEAAYRAAPEDPTIAQAFAVIHGEALPPAPADEGVDGATEEDGVVEESFVQESVTALPETLVFAGLEGAQEGLLLLDAAGLVLGGALKTPDGEDVTERVAAYLAGVSQEASRTAKLLELGEWRGVSAEGQSGHVHVVQPTPGSMLLVMRDRSVPLGRLGMLAQRAAQAARRWLEQQG